MRSSCRHHALSRFKSTLKMTNISDACQEKKQISHTPIATDLDMSNHSVSEANCPGRFERAGTKKSSPMPGGGGNVCGLPMPGGGGNTG